MAYVYRRPQKGWRKKPTPKTVGISGSSNNVSLTGVAATAGAGTLSAVIGLSVNITGVAATGSAGSLTDTVDSNISLTGVAATGATHDLSVLIEQIIPGTWTTVTEDTEAWTNVTEETDIWTTVPDDHSETWTAN